MFSMPSLFNNYCQSFTENLDLFESPEELKFNFFDEIDKIIKKYWSQLKIIKLEQKFSIKRKFAFKPFTKELFKNILNNLSRNEVAGSDIPLNLIKEFTFYSFVPWTLCQWRFSEKRIHNLLKLSNIVPSPANMPTSNQRCFNVVNKRWNNVDPRLEMKQNLTSDFQRCTTLKQRWWLTLKQRWNNVDTTLSQCCFKVASS